MAVDINDDELFSIDKLQRDFQTKYTGRPADLILIGTMQDEMRTKLADLGFLATVRVKSAGGRIVPEIEILGRIGEKAAQHFEETDHERKRYDALARPSKELKKLSNNTHLLD